MKAIVTGHSRGIGAGIAAALLADGAEVLALSRKGGPAALAPHRGKGLTEVAIDLSDAAALAAWLDLGILASFLAGGSGPLLLVNNAGMVEPIGPAGTQGAAAIARAVALNVAAPLALADAFAAATDGAADRRIAHISSGAARHAYAGWSIYCATKAALDMHAQGVVADALPGLKIESLAPGIVDTAMQGVIRDTSAEAFPLQAQFVEYKASGALADPDAVGGKIVAHLLSPAFGAATVTDIRQL